MQKENTVSGSKSVIAFGELLWDLLPTGKALGGAPANFAYRVKSLGREVRLISRLGNDEFGHEARAILNHLGLSDTHVQTDLEHPTGTVPVTLTASGSPAFVIVPDVAYDYIAWTAPLAALAEDAALICFGTLAQRSPVTRTTLHHLLAASSGTKLLDINLRPDCYSEETVLSSLERADIVKLNEDEVEEVGRMFRLPVASPDAFAAALFDRFPVALCLITRGAAGVLGFGRDGERADVPGRSVTVVDTIGAGDAFTAGFVHEYLSGSSLTRCCEFGNRLGAAVATVAGGMTPVQLPE